MVQDAETTEQTQSLYDIILKELQGMSDVEVTSTSNFRTRLSDLRYLGEIGINYRLKPEDLKENPVLRFFQRMYRRTFSATNMGEIKERLAKNPYIGMPSDESYGRLCYQKHLGMATIDMSSFDGKEPILMVDRVIVTKRPLWSS